MSRPKIRASDLGSLAYCERKVRLEVTVGAPRSAERERLAAAGTARHAAFEKEGGGDRRCFIATCVYGIDAPETHRLRTFRDRFLMPSAAGRFLVATYYRVSPRLIPWLGDSYLLWRAARMSLDVLVRRLP